MKKIILSLITFTLLFSSCKKHDYHKVSFGITFLNTPSYGSSNFIEVYATPSYTDKKPNIDNSNIPQTWRYDYMELEKGQLVNFLVRGQLSYHFEMRVYIDDNEVSYREVVVSNTTYYDDHVINSSGINDLANEDTGVIQFTY